MTRGRPGTRSSTRRPWRPSSPATRGPPLLDVRWRLGGPPGRDGLRRRSPARRGLRRPRHRPRRPARPRRPPPAARRRRSLQDALRRLGVSDDRPVVVYDDGDGGCRGPRLVAAALAGPPRRTRSSTAGSPPGSAAGGRSRPATSYRPQPATSPRARRPARARRRRGRRLAARRACCSTPAPPSATAARSSRSTRSPATSRARSTPRPPATSAPTAASCRRPTCGPGSPRSASRPARGRRRLLRLRRHRRPRRPRPRAGRCRAPAALYAGSWSRVVTDPARPVATRLTQLKIVRDVATGDTPQPRRVASQYVATNLRGRRPAVSRGGGCPGGQSRRRVPNMMSSHEGTAGRRVWRCPVAT